MSEEKLYAVKNDEGEWLSFNDTQEEIWYSNNPTLFKDKSYAEAQSMGRKAHVVALIEEPEKVVLTKEQAEIVEKAHGSNYPATYISDSTDGEELIMKAYVNGYTVAKEKKYVLPMPGTKYHNAQMRGIAQYYAVKTDTNWRPDTIALGTDDAIKHGYTVTQADIDAAPDWVKALTPVEVTDDIQTKEVEE